MGIYLESQTFHKYLSQFSVLRNVHSLVCQLLASDTSFFKTSLCSLATESVMCRSGLTLMGCTWLVLEEREKKNMFTQNIMTYQVQSPCVRLHSKFWSFALRALETHNTINMSDGVSITNSTFCQNETRVCTCPLRPRKHEQRVLLGAKYGASNEQW